MKYICKKCNQEVKPQKRLLICCGITERVPLKISRMPSKKSSACKKCGGYPIGSATGRFLHRECMCNEVEYHYDEEL